MKISRAFVAILAVLLLACADSAGAEELFTDVAGETSARVMVDSDILKRRVVRMDLEHLKQQSRRDGKIRINLFDGVVFDGRVEKVERRAPERFTLSGRLEGEEFSSFTLVVNGDVFAMNVRDQDGDFYQVRFLEKGLHEVRQINERKFPECATEAKHAIAAKPGVAAKNPPQGDDAGNIIDVMVIYTAAARQAAGGTAAIEALVDLAVSESNTAYQESLVTPRIRLVFRGEISYSEFGFDANGTDLIRLTNPSDGFLDEVHNLRNAYGADLVSLWIDDSSSCGLAWLMQTLSPSFEASAFGVVHWNCATTTYAFAHELAHNMGCQHNREDSGGNSGLYSYSYGRRFAGTNGTLYRTIMAYDTASPAYTRIPRFSNPSVLYAGTATGVPIGQANESHNTQTINNSALTVANFRQSVSTNTPPIIVVQPQPQIVPLGATAVFEVSASGTMPLSYQWRKGGTNISGATTNRYTIANVQLSDTNNYAVVITNSFGALTSSIVSLTISPPLNEVLDATNLIWTSGGHAPWIGQTNFTFDGIDAAQSGAITDWEESWFETTLTGPGVLKYWCKVSSETNFDFFHFLIDGATNLSLSGNVDWAERTVNLPAGNHVCRWRYAKDFSDSVGQDKAWVDQVSFIPTISLAEALDNAGFIWTTDGAAEWFGQDNISFSGNDAAQSGMISNEQFTALETTVVGPGTLSFRWKVSSEDIFDRLDFFINGNLAYLPGLSGDVDWEPGTFSIPPGTNTVRWEYRKDENTSVGADSAWVDQIVYAAGSSFLPNTAQVANGQFQIQLLGLAGASYTLQASTNLTNWVSLTNLVSSNVNIFISDTNLANFERRFYRIISP